MAADKQVFSDPQQLTDHVRECFRQAIREASSPEKLKTKTGSTAFGQHIIASFQEKYNFPPMAEDFKTDALAAEQQVNANGKGVTNAINYISKEQNKELAKSFSKYHALFASPPSKKEGEDRMMEILDVKNITKALAQRFIPNEINKINVSLKQHDAEGKLPTDLARALDLGYAANLLISQGRDASPESNSEEFKKYTQQAYAVYDIAPILITMPQQVYAILGESEAVPPDTVPSLHDMARIRHLEVKKWLDTPFAKAAFSGDMLELRKTLNEQALQKVIQPMIARIDSMTLSSPQVSPDRSKGKNSPIPQLKPGCVSPSEASLPPSVKYGESFTKIQKGAGSISSPLRFILDSEGEGNSPPIRRGTTFTNIQERESNIPSPLRLDPSHTGEGSSSPPIRRGTSFTKIQKEEGDSPKTLRSHRDDQTQANNPSPSIKRAGELEQAINRDNPRHVDQLIKSREGNSPGHTPVL